MKWLKKVLKIVRGIDKVETETTEFITAALAFAAKVEIVAPDLSADAQAVIKEGRDVRAAVQDLFK
tara:strand:+ start:162 stop:359 length:198 start_codon:yes stop_codon:yes gene_type:complete